MQTVPGQSAPRRDPWTIAQLVISVLGLVLSLLAAAGLALFGVIGLVGASADYTSLAAIFSMAWISLLVAILAVPSIIFSIQRLGGSAPRLPGINGFRWASTLIFIWPLALFLGSVISRQPRIAWLLLPPLQLLIVGLPVWWLFELARRKLPAGSRQRGWGVVNFSILITTPLLMIVEIVVMGILIVLFAVWASTQPQIVTLLQNLVQRLQNAPSNPEAIVPLVEPLLRNPLVILGAFVIIAGLIPLIEELFKPLAVWALMGHRLTPAEGFVAGALCGAAFTLMESLLYLSSPTGQGWAFLAVARTGTELLHITTAALTGWALASAWQNKTYLKSAATYLLAVLLHGLWNGLTILTGLGGTIQNPPASLLPLIRLYRLAPVALGLLVIVLFALLWWFNRNLQRQSNPQLEGSPVETGAEANPSSQSS